MMDESSGSPVEADDIATLMSQRREQRLKTLALGDQITEKQWREPLLPGDRTLHDQLAHILAWDEWAIAAFDISAMRALPESLVTAMRDSDEFNARTEKRYRSLTRDDILSALQWAVDRVALSAERSAPTGHDWAQRRISDLAGLRVTADGDVVADPSATAGPPVSGLLRHLLAHERAHVREITAAFGVEPDLERYRAQEDEDDGTAPQAGENR